MKKKIIIAVVLALILAAAGAVVYVYTNLDSLVKAAIEKFGSQATKTAVRVSSVKIKLREGEGVVRGLQVANPAGFSFPSIMTLGDMAIRIEVNSVTGSPIVIDRFLISGPEVFYEKREDGTTNIDVLTKNLAPSGPAAEERPKKNANEKEIRLRIRKLVFEKGKVHVRMAKLSDKPVTVELPRLELTDIGGHGGATPEQIARIMATALAGETAKAVLRSQGWRIRQGAEDLLKKYLNR